MLSSLMVDSFAIEPKVEEKTLTFTNDVIGLNLKEYNNEKKSGFTDSYLGIVPEENIRYNFQSNGSNLDILYTFSDGALRMVDVLEIDGSPHMSKSPSGVIDMAKGFLNNCQDHFVSPFYGELGSMLGDYKGEKSYTKISNNVKLEVKNSGESTNFKWTYIVNGAEATSKCVVLGYENGVLKYFIDNWDLYKVGNTDVNLSEKGAIDLAISYAKDFSWGVVSGEKIIQIDYFNVTNAMLLGTGFCSSVAADVPRSEYPLTIFPIQYVWVSLDKFYPGNVYGIEVAIWADTKELCFIRERFSTSDPPSDLIAEIDTNSLELVKDGNMLFSSELIVSSLIITFLLGTVSIWFIRQNDSRLSFPLSKVKSLRLIGLLFSSLLFSVVFVSGLTVFGSEYAGRATIWGSESTGDTSYYGSTGRKTITEIINQRSVANSINTKFNNNGYYSSNYQGDGSIKASILSNISYNEENYPLVAVVDFDHGVGRDDYLNLTEFHYMFEDNIAIVSGEEANGSDPDNWVNKNMVYDMDIFNETENGNTFFAFINTCKSADISESLGNWTLVEGGGLYPSSGNAIGLPFAWTHRQVVDGGEDGEDIDPSENMTMYGYADPDDGPHCYIGYNNGSAALSQIVDPNYPLHGHVAWVSAFFNYALYSDMTIIQALDYASYQYYSSGLNDTLLYNGFNATWPMWDQELEGWYPNDPNNNTDQIVIYGNGNIKLYQPLLNITAADDEGIPISVSVTIDGESVGSTSVSERVSNFPAEEHTIQVSVPNGYFFQNFTVGANTYVTNPATISVTSDATVVAYFTDDPPQTIPVEIFIDSIPDDGYSRYHALTVDNDIPTVFWTGDWYNQNHDAIIAITGTTLHYETAFYLTEGNHTIEYAVSSAIGYEWTATITVNDVVKAQQETNRYNQVSTNITVEPGDWYWISPSSAVDYSAKWTQESYAYDNNTVTHAYVSSHAINDWSAFLELQTDSTISSNKLRIYCASLYDGALPYADIDVYDTDTTSWINVYQGYVNEETWVTKTFSTRNVNAMRIRFYEGGIVYPHRLYEVDFWGTY